MVERMMPWGMINEFLFYLFQKSYYLLRLADFLI